jgi:hypothetical protein
MAISVLAFWGNGSQLFNVSELLGMVMILVFEE